MPHAPAPTTAQRVTAPAPAPSGQLVALRRGEDARCSTDESRRRSTMTATLIRNTGDVGPAQPKSNRAARSAPIASQTLEMRVIQKHDAKHDRGDQRRHGRESEENTAGSCDALPSPLPRSRSAARGPARPRCRTLLPRAPGSRVALCGGSRHREHSLERVAEVNENPPLRGPGLSTRCVAPRLPEPCFLRSTAARLPAR